jgi:hypothetical protein
VFSGAPIWALREDQILADTQMEVAGPHTHTATGIPLGSSYFGIYLRPTLDRVIDECQVTLNKYTDIYTCAPAFRAFLHARRLVRHDYVPTKLLTLAYTHLDLPVVYHESTAMHHIGGYSMATYQQATTDLSTGDRPASAAEILDFTEHRPHMVRKTAVCQRLMTSFAHIDHGRPPHREPAFPTPVEDRIQLIEDLYTRQAAAQANRPPP